MNRQGKTRLFTMLLCVCFITGFFLTTAFIIEHSDHDCIGHGCPVCVQIHLAENLLKQLSIVISCVAFASACLFALFNTFLPVIQNIFLVTPVTQKIRMNN
ncbi:MAG: hypothetical protein PHE79_08985 [Eubacteriales bacterium]|jgi:hypothetical protein|nr:hypothetical protein [Eubacteriales bacterium]